MREVIHTPNAPNPVGAYSQAIKHNGVLSISGQLGIDPQTGQLVSNNIGAQTRQTLQNIQAIVTAAGGGADLSRILKCTVFLKDIAQFAEMNQVYATFFPNNPPARAAFEVSNLPVAGALVEIEATAML